MEPPGTSGHSGLIRSYLLVQVVVTLGLVPVLAGSFGSVSLVSALVNLYAIPLYTLLIVPAVLVSCAVATVADAAGAAMLDWTGRLIESTWPLIEVPASWPLATWSIAGLDGIALDRPRARRARGAVAVADPGSRCRRRTHCDGLPVATCARA